MKPGEWARVRRVFEGLLHLPPEEREPALRETPGTSARLRREVARLLELHDGAGDFMEEPVARLVPDAELAHPRLGDLVGAYRLVRQIAKGGMGLVYVAERADDLYEKEVAVKFLSPDTLTEEDRNRFAHERRVLAQIDHPAVAGIIDGGNTSEGWPYLIMELVDGKILTRYCSETGRDLGSRLALFTEVCRGLQAAHRAGIVHGDVKPANVLVTIHGEPRIIDFGIAVGTREPVPESGELQALTPVYASPEQRRGAPLTTASDVYSLGIVLFKLATGRLPGQEEALDRGSIARAVSSGRIATRADRATTARSLGFVVAKATAEDPDQRYSSAEELARDVERISEGLPPRAMEGHNLQRLVTTAVRLRRGIAISLAVLIAAGLGWTIVDKRNQERVERMRRFVGEAQRIEYESQLEAMLPRHDVRPFRERLRERVDGFGGQLSGGWAAPVRYAMGVGELQLGEYRAARDNLEAAWEGGLRTPEVAGALIQALGRLYAEDLQRADETLEPEAAEHRRQLVTRRYRERIATLEPILEEATGTDAEYLRVLSDYLTGQPEKAWQRLRRLDPDRRDPRTSPLEGDILMLRSVGLRAGDPERALEFLREAGSAYARAKVVRRSDLAIHAADCDRAVFEIALRRGVGEVDIPLESALENCSQALEIHPGNPTTLARKAQLFVGAVQEDLLRGRDPGKNARLALAVADEVKGDPESVATAQKWTGTVLTIQAKWEMLHGGDPRPLLDRSIRHFETALRSVPRDVSALNNIGNAWGIRYRYLEGLGRPSAEPLERAAAAYEKALAVESFPAVYVNLGVAHQKRAELAMGEGADPSEWFEEAERHLGRALEVSPGRAIYWERAANVDLAQARFAVQRHQDSASHLDEALRKLRHAVRIDPECLDCRLTLAEGLLLRARSSLASEGSAAGALGEAEALLARLQGTARGQALLTEARTLRERHP